LARSSGDERGVAGALMFQAVAAAAGGTTRRAWVLNEAAVNAARKAGDRWLIGATLLELGTLAVDMGALQSAVPLLEEGLEVSRELRVHTRVGQFAWQLGRVALAQGEIDRALPLLETLRVAARERRSPRGLAAALLDLGRVAHARGKRAEALTLLRESLRLRHSVDDRLGSIECLETLAALEARVEPLRAAWLLGAAAAGRRALGTPPSSVMQNDLDVSARSAEAAVGTAAFQAAQTAGELTPLEQAIIQGMQSVQ
jgi:non-specific serine/threonine protein kinase